MYARVCVCVCVCVCVYIYMHFILSFKYHVFNARKWSVRPEYVACTDGNYKICLVRRQHVCQF